MGLPAGFLLGARGRRPCPQPADPPPLCHPNLEANLAPDRNPAEGRGVGWRRPDRRACRARLVAVAFHECQPSIPTQPDHLDPANAGGTHPVSGSSLSLSGTLVPSALQTRGAGCRSNQGREDGLAPRRTSPQRGSRGGRGPSSPSCSPGQLGWGRGETKGWNRPQPPRLPSPLTAAPPRPQTSRSRGRCEWPPLCL